MKSLCSVFCFFLAFVCVWGEDTVILLNEYNAVDKEIFLNGGDNGGDQNGNKSVDTHFGRIKSNGGDWFELVVVADHLDIRGWTLEYSWQDSGTNKRKSDSIRLTEHKIWSDLRSGTIITFSEEVADDVSFNPALGDWWINIRVHKDFGSGLYTQRKSIKVNASDWQLTIRDKSNVIRFGPAGEGIYPRRGINQSETFRLEADPSRTISADSEYYDSGKSTSTFGAPNQWGDKKQNFDLLRAWAR